MASCWFLLFLVGTFINRVLSLTRGGKNVTNVGIIGGHNIRIQNAPYMASLRMLDANRACSHVCGATIIDEQHVLTAAHCCWYPMELCEVVVGSDILNDNGGEHFEIDWVMKHEDFNVQTAEYDVCVVKIVKPMTFGPKVQKIALAASALEVPNEAHLKITGWGLTEAHYLSPKLLQVEVPKIPLEECKEIYLNAREKYSITSHMICAGVIGHGGCNGDSGGPLTFGKEQVGIASFVSECGSRNPTVFTKIASVFTWIIEKINKS